MATHPSGVVVDIVGIKRGDRGRSCEEHEVCGTVLSIDCLVRLRKVNLCVGGREEAAIAVYWVSDGVDRCRVGFLPRHFVKHYRAYDGKLAQVTEFLATSDSPGDVAKSNRCCGVCRAVLVEAESTIRKRSLPPTNDYETPKKKIIK